MIDMVTSEHNKNNVFVDFHWQFSLTLTEASVAFLVSQDK